MGSYNWKKIENEAGYPYYIDETSGKQQHDHPQFQKIMESLEEYNDIKYNAYKVAFKLFCLQKELRVPPLRISSGVFARHQLSLSESSLSIDATELEAVLTDIYFAAEKEGLFTGDIDLAVDLLINLLLNVYDKDRKQPIRVLATKTLLIILSEESVSDKWSALANCCADHNACVSPKRLAALLGYVMALPQYLGTCVDQIQIDVDACFDKNAGMLGISASSVAEWATENCISTLWLPVVQRVVASRNSSTADSSCGVCAQPLIQVLKFKCLKCNDLYFCEKCYLYDKDLTTATGHKKSHAVNEIIDGEMHPSQCKTLMRSIRRFFFCTKTKKKTVTASRKSKDKEVHGASKKRKGKPVIFTSTVGKASGHRENNPMTMLQDIITQLEAQNQVLNDLLKQFNTAAKEADDELKVKIEAHYNQIAMHINGLKIVKDKVQATDAKPSEAQKSDKPERPQAFHLFSPIAKETKSESLKAKKPTRLSDSGFSVTIRQADSQDLLTMSGDSMKPVVHTTTDSISTVSMNDISNWYNEPESQVLDKGAPPKPKERSQSISLTEQRFAADIRCVAHSNDQLKQSNANMEAVLDRLQEIFTDTAIYESCVDNNQLLETANEMEGLLGTLIRGVEERATLNANNSMI